MTKNKAIVGSICSGTNRISFLIEAFAAELRSLDEAGNASLLKEANEWLTTDDDLADAGYDLVDDLADALNKYAPPNCYFGAHEGNLSDYGFWPL